MSIQEKCRVLKHQQLSPQHFHLTLSSAYISSHALPGRFVNVKCSAGTEPLLRRPFGIHRTDKVKQTFDLLYEVVGQGTELLSHFQVGQELDVLGPLGSGFSLDPQKRIAIIVAGGMGVAPMLALAEKIEEKPKSGKADSRIISLIGANTKDNILCVQDFKALGAEVLVATDDGSYGYKGLVTDLLPAHLNDRSTTIYACGPKPMLEAVAAISAQKKITCQVSVEQKMACGFGTCLGCVIQTKDGYKRVCHDGPVFDSNVIVWEGL